MVDRTRLAEELRRVKELLRTNPKLLAKFDKDGNGVIDGEEWEAVRQLVIRRLKRKEAEEAEAERLLAEAAREGVDVDVEEERRGAAETESVAEDVYRRDVARAYGPEVIPSAGTGSLVDMSEWVLEQRSGLKAMMEGLARRHYFVRDMPGNELASLEEQSSDFMRSMKIEIISTRSWNTGFSGIEIATGQSIGIALEINLVGCNLTVVADRGDLSCRVSQVSVLGRKFEIRGAFDETSIYVVRPWLQPFTLKVVDAFDEPIGECVRGWTGLKGMLSNANATRFSVDPEHVSPAARWGLVALSLYLDVKASRRN